MRPFVVILDRGDPQPRDGLARALLARVPRLDHEGDDVVRVARAPGVTLASRAASDGNILVDSEAGLVVLCRGRVDHLDALAAELGLAQGVGATAVIAALWRTTPQERRHEAVARLEGDFALVVWDAQARRLDAARDAFGAGPLAHRRVGTRLVLSSHLECLIAPELGASPSLDDAAVLAHLTLRPRDATRTFFRGVAHLPSGHVWSDSETGVVTTRHFVLPPVRGDHPTTGEIHEELRSLFFRSVEARFVSEAPVLAQLSGGIDSTAVAFTAAALARQGRLRTPSVVLVSGVYPHRTNDESAYLDDAARRLPFAMERRDATRVRWEELERIDPTTPRRALSSAGELEVARAVGARVLVSGLGGDEVAYEAGVSRDLAASHRFAELVRVLVGPGRYSTRPLRSRLRDALGGAVPPVWRAWLRRRHRVALEPAPGWAGEAARRCWSEDEPDLAGEFASETQRITWSWLTRVATVASIEREVRDAAREGLSLRMPWYDRRLATFFLSLPWEARIPRRGMKSLAREALPMSPSVASRVRATTHEDGPLRTLATQIGRLRPTLALGPWRAAPYVRREVALERLAQAEAGLATWREVVWLWDVACLECWLRGFDIGGVFANPTEP